MNEYVMSGSLAGGIIFGLFSIAGGIIAIMSWLPSKNEHERDGLRFIRTVSTVGTLVCLAIAIACLCVVFSWDPPPPSP